MGTQASGIEDMNRGSRASEASLVLRASSFTSVAWVVSFFVVWLSASVALANSAPLPVSFTGTGRELPQAEIRVAIATELGRETLVDGRAGGEGEANGEGQAGRKEGGEPDSTLGLEQDTRERVLVAVDELGQLWVRYWGPRGLVDRHLAMPVHAEQIPLVVSLSVGNLVRQEAFELLRDLERRRAEQASATAAAKASAPPDNPTTSRSQPVATRAHGSKPRSAEPAPRRNSWGHYLVGDFPYFPSVDRACSLTSDSHCYDENNEQVFYDVPGRGVAGGLNAAHARYVMAYTRALTPDVWASVRVGFAFSGGKGKNATSKHDPVQSKFMPWLFELRLQDYPLPGALNGALRPYVHVAAGIAEQSAELKMTAPSAFDGTGTVSEAEAGQVTLIHATGLLFAGAGLGASLSVLEQLRLEAELSAFLAFPSNGWSVRPGIGLSYDF
jgi:hypothetical protein